MKVRNFNKGKVIDLVHGYQPRLEDWTHADIVRAAAHVWDQIRLHTKEEIMTDLSPFFAHTGMTPNFQKRLVGTMMHASQDTRRLRGGETGERLRIPYRFADGRLIVFDLRMKSEAEVRHAFLEAQQKTPEAVF